jgi:murein DD-endopeptidase MepM/ murein hydrolase activator NlpD
MHKSLVNRIAIIFLLLVLANCGQPRKSSVSIQKEPTKKILNSTTKALNKRYNLNNLDVALLYNLDNSTSDLMNRDYVKIINSSNYSKKFLASKHHFNKNTIEQNAKIRLQQLWQLLKKIKQNNIHIKGLKLHQNPKYFNTLVNLHHKYIKFLPVLFPSTSRLITSNFGVRTHPIQKKKIFHYGIDIASQDRLIFSAAQGLVDSVETKSNGYGNNITIDHQNGIKTFYAHLDKIYVSPGQKVLQGELIGIEGSTGKATGIHLHFETKYKDDKINPMIFYR